MNDILIYEVGARDGLQNEAIPMDTQQKIKLIKKLKNLIYLYQMSPR